MGMVFDIQHYAVHDGPGIRTLVFLKGCPLACRWCCNPESQAFHPELRHVAFRCRKCLRCVEACPHGPSLKAPRAPSSTAGRATAAKAGSCVEQCPGGALLRTGRDMPATEVIEEVAKDLDFYRNSGGGATFSGGEPFAQPAFLLELLRLAKHGGISTAVETCGHAAPQDLRSGRTAGGLFPVRPEGHGSPAPLPARRPGQRFDPVQPRTAGGPRAPQDHHPPCRHPRLQ